MIAQTLSGRQRPVCPACGHAVYRQLKVGAGVLVERDGRLLLVRRGPTTAFAGTWNLPAGYCEADEDPRATAVREAAEETGLAVQAGPLVGAYYFEDDPRGNGLLIVYEAQAAPGEPRCDGEETTDVGFFAPEELPRPLCGGGHDRAIEAWRQRCQDRWQPGTPLRFCPHCAHALEEREAFGKIRPLCPLCGFVHFAELKVGVSIMVEQDGRLLLVQRGIQPGLGKWGLPSGFVDPQEAPPQAAVRECCEETGLYVESPILLDVIHYTDDFRGPGINLVYSARVAGGTLRSGDDAAQARFFAPEELPLPSEIAFRGHQRIIDHWAAPELADLASPLLA